MTDDERDELLIRLDAKFDARVERDAIVDKRLDAHAADIKSLREWRNYLVGAWAAACAWVEYRSKA
jgi:hypothetical protein